MGFWFRVRDVLFASVSLCISFPLFLLIAIALYLTQKQVLFFQRRPGYKERPFTLYKFSTLRPLRPGEQEGINEHVRITPVGKWLRKTSLDELPQLINVLQGDMSLVGPRPLRMEYLELYSAEERKRHTVKPGEKCLDL